MHIRTITIIVSCLLLLEASVEAKRLRPFVPTDIESRYERAINYPNEVRNKVLRDRIDIHWTGIHHFAYSTPTGRLENGKLLTTYYLVDTELGEQDLLFDHEKVAEALGALLNREVSRFQLPIKGFEVSEDLNRVHITTDDDKKIEINRKTSEAVGDTTLFNAQSRFENVALQDSDNGQDKKSDTKSSLIIEDHNLVLIEEGTNEKTKLTDDGTADYPYAITDQMNPWSPSRNYAVVSRNKPGNSSIVHRIEVLPENSIKAKLHTDKYIQPGDPMDEHTLFVVDIADKKVSKLDMPTITYLADWEYKPGRLDWDPDGGRALIGVTKRGHQSTLVFDIDMATVTVNKVIDEKSDTFLDSTRYYFKLIEDRTKIIWASERDGWRHLYLYNRASGSHKQVTNGNWLVEDVKEVDEESGIIHFTARGFYPDQDPYFIHHFKINTDGSGLVPLTDGNGTHEIRTIKVKSGAEFIIDKYSRIDMAGITELRNADTGKLVVKLQEVDISQLLETGWRYPEVFRAKGRDGQTDIWGMVVKPRDFDPRYTYPVIEYIYAGPHDSHVPKRFTTMMRMIQLAELGFISVMVDGMGTANRGKAFHDVCWQNLADAGFPDRILWHNALAEYMPNCDISNVGIYGTSAGGQSSTGALLFHGDFNKVAVSSCGCHDNRVDKRWWNEQWMGYPIGEHYKKQSNVTNAHNLTGKLLLMVGDMDTNVPPESTMQVVSALIKAEKEFELLVVPGMGHSSGGRYGQRRRWDFFMKHVHGITPPDWNNVKYPER